MNSIVDELVAELDAIRVASSSSSVLEREFPEIFSRSNEKLQTVLRMPFTYFPVFPTPVVSDQIDRSLDSPVTTREYVESLSRLIPSSLSPEDVLSYSAIFFRRNFSHESSMAKRICLLMCVIGTIKQTSETSCNGLLARAAQICIGSVNQPRFQLTIDELEKVEVWFVCKYIFNSEQIMV